MNRGFNPEIEDPVGSTYGGGERGIKEGIRRRIRGGIREGEEEEDHMKRLGRVEN